MATEYHLKLNGAPGESGSGKHKDEIEVLSWSWGASNPTNVHGSGLSAGKVSFADIAITKPVDKASAKLLELCCTGKHVDKGVLTCSKSTGDKSPEDFLTIELNEIHISGVQHGGSSGQDIGTESITLAFGKISFDYKIQKADGTQVSAGKTGYDIIQRLVS
jgi:type VI secretion system secreted protein Hcp